MTNRLSRWYILAPLARGNALAGRNGSGMVRSIVAISLLGLSVAPILAADDSLRVRFPVTIADSRAAISPPYAVGTPPPATPNFDPYMPATPPTVLQRLMPATAAPTTATPYYALQPAAVPAVAPASNGWVCWPSGWYGEVEAIYFDRDNRARDQAVVLNATPPPNTDNSVLRTSDVSFDPMVGPRGVIGYDWDQFVAWEATYFGIYAWNDTDIVTGDNLELPDSLGQTVGFDFLRANTVVAEFRSSMQNGELNRIRSLNQNFAWLAGFRYVNVNERFRITSVSDITGTSIYQVKTRNDLYGGQLGGRLRQTYGSFGLEILGKAGVYGNASFQRNFVGNDEGTVLRDTKTTGGNVAFVGDLWLTGRMQLTDSISLEGGYGVMWIEQIALALEQLDFTNNANSGTALDTEGALFAHGAHAGLLVVW
ncbi:MAG: BBP7 family outer membrane beta-barrel protein [Pirellulaceae bacterium]|nr:BBP7 family outer membrane beta-barrel protein [Pirellulaceae bacterium]